MLEQITKDIKKMLAMAGATEPIELAMPPKPELGDFAFPCFGLAKERKISPVEAAKTLVEEIKKSKNQK